MSRECQNCCDLGWNTFHHPPLVNRPRRDDTQEPKEHSDQTRISENHKITKPCNHPLDHQKKTAGVTRVPYNRLNRYRGVLYETNLADRHQTDRQSAHRELLWHVQTCHCSDRKISRSLFRCRFTRPHHHPRPERTSAPDPRGGRGLVGSRA